MHTIVNYAPAGGSPVTQQVAPPNGLNTSAAALNASIKALTDATAGSVLTTIAGSTGQLQYSMPFIRANYKKFVLNTQNFTPLAMFPSISAAPVLWLDASSLSPTGALASWPDLSSSGNNATSSSGNEPSVLAAESPTGLNVVQVNPSDPTKMVLDTPFYDPSNYTAFFAGAPASGGNLLVMGPATSGELDPDLMIFFGGYFFSTTQSESIGANAPFTNDGSWQVWRARNVSGAVGIYQDGVQLADANFAVAGSLNWGSIAYRPEDGTVSNGAMGELLIFNAALSDSDCAAVEAYLQAKWIAAIAIDYPAAFVNSPFVYGDAASFATSGTTRLTIAGENITGNIFVEGF